MAGSGKTTGRAGTSCTTIVRNLRSLITCGGYGRLDTNIIFTCWETQQEIIYQDGSKYTQAVPRLSGKSVDTVAGLCNVVQGSRSGKKVAISGGKTPTEYAKGSIAVAEILRDQRINLRRIHTWHGIISAKNKHLKKIPEGTYRVRIDDAEMTQSKAGKRHDQVDDCRIRSIADNLGLHRFYARQSVDHERKTDRDLRQFRNLPEGPT